MHGDGDGWVECAAGHRHWGRFGAAGLLISDGERAILQHRAPWTHEGDRWGLPGGARDSHEDPTSTALREAFEEAAITADLIEPTALWIEDHGGWSYTTVLARPRAPVTPYAANAESTDVRWCSHDEIETLPLHHGLAATWPQVRGQAGALSVVVDVRGVIGLQRLAQADAGSRRQLDALARHGVPVSALPAGVSGSGATALLPRFAIVDASADAPPTSDASDLNWWDRAISVVTGGRDGDSDVVDIAGRGNQSDQTIVVTEADLVGERLARIIPNAAIVGTDWFLELLERQARG